MGTLCVATCVITRRKMKIFLAILAMVQAVPGVTTHVLDLSLGLPGTQIEVKVFKQPKTGPVDDAKLELMNIATTNNDGRTDEPVIGESDFTELLGQSGYYFKLSFDLETYYDGDVFFPGADLVSKVEQNQITEHFHVPILCTPYSFTTYRGNTNEDNPREEIDDRSAMVMLTASKMIPLLIMNHV